MWNGFKVIDSDAHHHEPMDIWDRYLEPEYKSAFPRSSACSAIFSSMRRMTSYLPCLNRASEYSRPSRSMDGGQVRHAYDQWWSPDIRLKDMDRYGWDIQVILSTNGNRIMEAALKEAEVGGGDGAGLSQLVP